MLLENKKVFLAGATGMAGISILKYITDNFPTVRVVGSYHNTKPIIENKRVEYACGDLRSIDDCRKMVRGCDYAVMAAAYAGGAGYAKSHPWEHMKENLLMNMQMLDAFHLESIKKIVFIGSATLYQEFEGAIKEDELDFNKEPHESYFSFAWGMRFLEKLCKFLFLKFNIEIIIVRSSNIFGPYAKFDPKVSNFIPAIIRKAVDKMDPFEVWGTPNVTRDVIFAEDFAKAIVKILDNDKIKFDIFNIGSGVKTTVADIVTWALKYAEHTPSQINYIEDKPTTIKFRALDCRKAQRLLGWQPQCSIEEGVKKTVEWWIENKENWKK